MTERPSAEHGRWLLRIVAEAIDEIYKVDLLEDELLTPSGLKRPTQELIDRLFAHAKVERDKHYRLMQQRQYKKAAPRPGADEEFWVEQAKTHLFRSKRSEELGRLLGVRVVLAEHLAR